MSSRFRFLDLFTARHVPGAAQDLVGVAAR
jgi:hypothetical protein